MTPPEASALRFGAVVAAHASRATAAFRATKHYAFTGISPVPVASIIGCVLVAVGLGAGLWLILLSRPRLRPLHRRRAPPKSSGATDFLHRFRMAVVEEDPPSQRGVPVEEDSAAPPEPIPARR